MVRDDGDLGLDAGSRRRFGRGRQRTTGTLRLYGTGPRDCAIRRPSGPGRCVESAFDNMRFQLSHCGNRFVGLVERLPIRGSKATLAEWITTLLTVPVNLNGILFMYGLRGGRPSTIENGWFAGHILTVSMAAKCQTERGDEFPKRCSCAIELLHQRVLRRSVKVSVGSHGGEVIDHCWGNSNILASILPSNFKLE